MGVRFSLAVIPAQAESRLYKLKSNSPGLPAASHFLLLRQKKVTKEKGASGARSRGLTKWGCDRGGAQPRAHLIRRTPPATGSHLPQAAGTAPPFALDPRFAGRFATSLRYSIKEAAAELGPFRASDSPRRLPLFDLRSSAALMGPKCSGKCNQPSSQPFSLREKGFRPIDSGLSPA
jgi:hypothetical protein